MSGVRHISLLFPGVVILFAMSGFLVSASWERAKTRKEFFLKRVLRIYPELWFCTIVNYFGAGIVRSEYDFVAFDTYFWNSQHACLS